jgi:hypothetical protein
LKTARRANARRFFSALPPFLDIPAPLSGIPAPNCHSGAPIVIPAQAGIQSAMDSRLRGNDKATGPAGNHIDILEALRATTALEDFPNS